MRHVAVSHSFVHTMLGYRFELGLSHNATSDRERRNCAHEIGVDLPSSHSPLIDAPDDQRLTSSAVSSSKDARNVGIILALGSLDVLAVVQLNLIFEESVIGAEETHRKEYEISWEKLIGVLYRLHVPSA